VDEDTCATNFMIRDDKMMQLVAPEKEPITPFVRKVRSLYEDLGISSILVIGGTGDYFDVANTVIMMDCYKCLDVTERAKQIVASSTQSDQHVCCAPIPFGMIRARYPRGDAYKANGKVKVRSKDDVSYGDIEIDLSALEQVVSKSQTTAISCALQTFARLATGSTSTLPEVLARLETLVDEGGLDALAPGQYNGGFARPRSLEIASAVNRFRSGDSMRQNLRDTGAAVGGSENMIQKLQDV
jgi:predicted ABC-class ATPase